MNNQEHNDNINILIAEDEKNIGDLLVEILSAPGRNIRIVHNGIGAIKALRREQFDILITDLMMPDADGIQVLHEAKNLNPQILVIIITGYASLETAIQAVKEGAYDYLRKPFRLEELKISVDNACDKITLLRENRILIKNLQESYIKLQNAGDEKDDLLQEPGFNSRAFIDIDRLPPSFFETGMLGKSSPVDTLERLTDLREKGVITHDEFTRLKNKLINNL
jgi:CheY-like chemotaxis protein